ncbi:MAG: sugar phosphate nucleotidyltransferase [candidate division WOR-3 bacterium]
MDQKSEMHEEALTIIIGISQGARLFPLTGERSKAALPFAGKYRLIDVPLSNCLNSKLRKIYVLTQFNSASLNRHIQQTYRVSRFSEPEEFVDVLAAEQTLESSEWQRSPSDAVRRAWRHFDQWKAKDYLILPGDQIYRMNYGDLIRFHRESGADLTLPVVARDEETAQHLGVVKIAGDHRRGPFDQAAWRVVEFREQPKGEALHAMRLKTARRVKPEARSADAPDAFSHESDRWTISPEKLYLASMGIYLFRKEVLRELLETTPTTFGFALEIVPLAVEKYRVYAYLHRGYWDNVDTVSSYYQAHMDLLGTLPPLNLYDPASPIYTRPRPLPPAKIRECQIRQSLVADGSILTGAELTRSIVGLRMRIERGARLEGVICFGAEYTQSLEEMEEDRAKGVPILGIGEGTLIRKAILDRNVRIGAQVRIINEAGLTHFDGPNYYIRDGIVLVPKNTVIPDGTVI